MLHEKSLDGTLVTFLSSGSEKKVPYTCDGCGKNGILIYHNYTIRKRKGPETFCKKCACQLSGVAKRGKPIKRTKPPVTGSAHHAWKGGKFVGSDGYVKVWQSPKVHKKEHLIVMEKAIKRPLTKQEVVHHIDGNKTNNELTNLVLLPSESEHRRVHNSLYNVSCQLVKKGLIGFDRNSNTYMAVGKLCELLEHPEEDNQQPSRISNNLERFND